MEQNKPKILNAWAFYDWANSVYNLLITTAIFPMFYTEITARNNPSQVVSFWGREVVNTALYSYVFSASFVVVVVLVPILSGIADFANKRKFFLQVFCYLGASACITLFWFNPTHLEWSMLSVFVGSIGFWGSLVFYNSYLPQIASPDRHDKLSAKGFSMGYVGSVLLLVTVLILHSTWPDFNFRYAFVAVGIWWAGFAQYTYYHLPPDTHGFAKIDREILFNGFRELRKTFKQVLQSPRLKRFLASYGVYNMGVQTVMLLAVLFAQKEINWPIDPVTGETEKSGLIIAIIIIQLIAILGAVFMARLSKRIGNIPVLIIGVTIWILVTIMAYFIHEPWEFYSLAAVVGFVMGGTQSMSRSTYAKFLPETKDHASFFSFFDVLEKMGLVLGPLVFGLIEDVTGTMRNSILALMSFFIIGLILLLHTRKAPSIERLDSVVKPL